MFPFPGQPAWAAGGLVAAGGAPWGMPVASHFQACDPPALQARAGCALQGNRDQSPQPTRSAVSATEEVLSYWRGKGFRCKVKEDGSLELFRLESNGPSEPLGDEIADAREEPVALVYECWDPSKPLRPCRACGLALGEGVPCLPPACRECGEPLCSEDCAARPEGCCPTGSAWQQL